MSLLKQRLHFLIYLSRREKSEIDIYLNSLLSISHRIDISHSSGIISQNKVNHILIQCEEVMEKCIYIRSLCSILRISSNLINIQKEIQNCKDKILSICGECGILEIMDYVYLINIT